MRTINLLLAVLLLSGCSIVEQVDSTEKAELMEAGFVLQQMDLAEGGTLNYWQAGQGKTLLLVHGFGGSAVISWQQGMLALSQK